jgi:hypothetical protein
MPYCSGMTNSFPDPLAHVRDFYRERMGEAFQHTERFAGQTQRTAEQILDTPEFDALLRDAKPGSLDAARRIGEMAVVHLARAPNAPGPWWRDLCHYERGWFLQTATTDAGTATNRPRRGVSALSTNFGWNMPKLLEALQLGTSITDALKRSTTLLFSRGAEGKIYVVEIGGNIEKVFRFTNGMRTIPQIADAAGVSEAETKKTLEALARIGAVAMSVY